MMARALLVLVLVMAVLFAWRAWRPYPGLAVLAAAIAVALGVLLLRHPALAAAGVLLAAGLLGYLSRRQKR